MIYKKHDYTIITNAFNIKYKTLINALRNNTYLKLYDDKIHSISIDSNNVDINNANGYWNGYKRQYSNNSILFFNDNGKNFSININHEYMDIKTYANGNEKTCKEFNICFSNFLDTITTNDLDSMLMEQRNSRRQFDWYANKVGAPIHFDEFGTFTLTKNMFTDNGINARINGKKCRVSNIPISATVTKCNYSEETFIKYNGNYQTGFVKYAYGQYIDIKYYKNNFIECVKCSKARLKKYFNDIFSNIKGGAWFVDLVKKNVRLFGNDKQNICTYCVDEVIYNLTRNSINGYSFKPDAKFNNVIDGKIHSGYTPLKALNFGWELELESRDYMEWDAMKVDALQIKNDSNGYLYIKEDSSIEDENSGFEIVSHPATFEAIQKMDLNNMVFKHRDKYKSFYTKNCGMHIHISKDAFTEFHLFKFSRMLNKYNALTHFVSQRRRMNEYKAWCNFNMNQSADIMREASYNIKQQKTRLKNGRIDKMKYKTSCLIGDRYNALNLQNDKSVEIRTFKGNLSERGFRKNIEFSHALYLFCYDVSLSKQNVDNLVKYVNDNIKMYPFLNEHFNVNTEALNHVIENPSIEI